MVAYSFKPRFVEAIQQGRKVQTIRAPRKRHARPGEQLQLYTGMRTKQCKLIREVKCTEVVLVRLRFENDPQIVESADCKWGKAHFVARSRQELDAFARTDGFVDWADMHAFWLKEHAGANYFEGVLIRWAP